MNFVSMFGGVLVLVVCSLCLVSGASDPVVLYDYSINFNFTLYAGSGRSGMTDGARLSATFSQPNFMRFLNNDIFLTDTLACRVRAINRDTGLVRSITGYGAGALASCPASDTNATWFGPLSNATIYKPTDLIQDPRRPNNFYVRPATNFGMYNHIYLNQDAGIVEPVVFNLIHGDEVQMNNDYWTRLQITSDGRTMYFYRRSTTFSTDYIAKATMPSTGQPLQWDIDTTWCGNYTSPYVSDGPCSLANIGFTTGMVLDEANDRLFLGVEGAIRVIDNLSINPTVRTLFGSTSKRGYANGYSGLAEVKLQTPNSMTLITVSQTPYLIWGESNNYVRIADLSNLKNITVNTLLGPKPSPAGSVPAGSRFAPVINSCGSVVIDRANSKLYVSDKSISYNIYEIQLPTIPNEPTLPNSAQLQYGNNNPIVLLLYTALIASLFLFY